MMEGDIIETMQEARQEERERILEIINKWQEEWEIGEPSIKELKKAVEDNTGEQK